MPLLKSDSYTTEYIYALPEGQRAELIDGVIYDIAPSSRIHQELSGELFAIIREYIKTNNMQSYHSPTTKKKRISSFLKICVSSCYPLCNSIITLQFL